MECLNIIEGRFEIYSGWNDSDSAQAGNIEITRTDTSLVVKWQRESKHFHHESKFKVVNNKYVFILYYKSGENDRRVSVIDTSNNSLKSETVIPLYNSNNNNPELYFSSGNSSIFMVVTFRPNERRAHGFFRSDNGKNIGKIPYNPINSNGENSNGEIKAKAEDGNLKIYFPNSGWKVVDNIPSGKCKVIDKNPTFKATVNTGEYQIDSSLTEAKRDVTIKNTGNDCLTIKGIEDNGPFSVIDFPEFTLEPGDDKDVTIKFTPTSTDVDGEEFELKIDSEPQKGDQNIVCKAEVNEPKIRLDIPDEINFGTTRVDNERNRTLTIRNDGDVKLKVKVDEKNINDHVFGWEGLDQEINPGSESEEINIYFEPDRETDLHDKLKIKTEPEVDNLEPITLKGKGCEPNAKIKVADPSDNHLKFGNVAKGFRTVKMVKVTNKGDGPLNFKARIDEGPNKELFGLQKEGTSITNPADNLSFTVYPTDPCGDDSGDGEVFFGVTFFANEDEGAKASKLIIDDHNATNIDEEKIEINLEAIITETVTLDAALVLDRSGSMSENAGNRNKIETVIAAGRLFVELMRSGKKDRIALLKYNQNPEVISSIQEITDNNKDDLKNKINRNNLNPQGDTSIAGGVMKAIDDLNQNQRADPPEKLNTSIVVLTDGKDNTPYQDPNSGEKYTLLGGGDTKALETPQGKNLYAVGIGSVNNIDKGKLGELCTNTGGYNGHVNSFRGEDYFGLEKYFTQIFMDSADIEQISDPVYTIEPNETHTIPIDILRGDTKLMVVVYDKNVIRIPFHLETPSGEKIDLKSVPPEFQIRPKITETARFIEVFFPEEKPEQYAGQWTFIAHHDGRACYFEYDKKVTEKDQAIPSLNDEHLQHFGPGFRPEKCEDNFEDDIAYGLAIGAGSNFRMMPIVEPGQKEVGDTIKLNALIKESGLPVTGCDVSVEVESPDNQIYNYNLIDDGEHKDDEQGDGNYGKVFTQTNREGHYKFKFKAIGESRDNEPVVREAVRSKYVRGITYESNVPGSTYSETGKEVCCRYQNYLLIAITILLLMIFVYLIWQV